MVGFQVGPNHASLIGRTHLCWSFFLIKLQQIGSATLLMFFCEICGIFKNTYFEEHLPTDASINEALLGKKNKSYLVNPVS